MATVHPVLSAADLVRELDAYIDRAVGRYGTSQALRPANRVKFHWPPHPVSYSFHVLASDWTGRATFEAHGETFDVKVATTPYGVFGRCEAIWHEERGDTVEEMLARLRESSEPLFQRQLTIADTLEMGSRFTGYLSDISVLDLLKLLYCEDRDVSNEAHTILDVRSSDRTFFPALLAILNDRRHPYRRSAQWCVLDLFEDLPTFCDGESDQRAAVDAMRGLIWDADDDYARTIYKAGVVLGGHLPYVYGGPVLLECLNAPSRIGRRAAIHGLFHVVEWVPAMKEQVLAALHTVAQSDPEPILREYARAMAKDIQEEEMDHAPDPFFPDER